MRAMPRQRIRERRIFRTAGAGQRSPTDSEYGLAENDREIQPPPNSVDSSMRRQQAGEFTADRSLLSEALSPLTEAQSRSLPALGAARNSAHSISPSIHRLARASCSLEIEKPDNSMEERAKSTASWRARRWSAASGLTESISDMLSVALCAVIQGTSCAGKPRSIPSARVSRNEAMRTVTTASHQQHLRTCCPAASCRRSPKYFGVKGGARWMSAIRHLQ